MQLDHLSWEVLAVNTRLVDAIDHMRALTKPVMTISELYEFCKQSEDVFVLAHQLGLQEALPVKSEMLTEDEADSGDFFCIGKLNLPGYYETRPELWGDEKERFCGTLNIRWIECISRLRRLALSTTDYTNRELQFISSRLKEDHFDLLRKVSKDPSRRTPEGTVRKLDKAPKSRNGLRQWRKLFLELGIIEYVEGDGWCLTELCIALLTYTDRRRKA